MLKTKLEEKREEGERRRKRGENARTFKVNGREDQKCRLVRALQAESTASLVEYGARQCATTRSV